MKTTLTINPDGGLLRTEGGIESEVECMFNRGLLCSANCAGFGPLIFSDVKGKPKDGSVEICNGKTIRFADLHDQRRHEVS